MKRTFLILSLASLLLCSCAGSTETSTAPAQDTATNAVTQAAKDLPDGDYEDTGSGEIEIVTSNGSSADGIVPVLYVEGDTLVSQIGLNAWELDGLHLSFIYIDGYLNDKQQLADSQITLDLNADNLSEGIHSVAVVQYKDDTPESEMLLYKAAEYEIKIK